MPCLVCGSRQSESHFGGNSCRACAAFFRRYFSSKKAIITCICKSKQANSHPCRSCRLAKCYAVGMTPAKIHGQRDPNGTCIRPTMTKPITPKTTFNITSSLLNFKNYESRRVEMYQKPKFQSFFNASSLTKKDTELTQQLILEVFPMILKIQTIDQKSLVNNFLLKIWNIEPVLDHVSQREEYRKMNDLEMKRYVFPFYDGSFNEGFEKDEDEIWSLFGTFWKFYSRKMIEPICDLNLDRIELMAVFWMLCFDHAYINLSESTSDLCWTIRKVITQELRNYELEKNPEDSETRFLEILEIPMIMERGEQYFYDEIMLWEMNKLRMHDDFKAILKRQKI